jgi:hypothetical protein
MAPNRCDCGAELGGVDEADQAARLIRHAAEAHGLVLSMEFAASAVRRASEPTPPTVTAADDTEV